MTRINLIDVRILSDQHLLAEYRELPRIFTHVYAHGVSKNIPKEFTLGKGHVLFFTDKLWFLLDRYYKLCNELQSRGFDIQHTPEELMDKHALAIAGQNPHYIPTSKDIMRSYIRILDKILQKPDFYKFRGKKLKELIQ